MDAHTAVNQRLWDELAPLHAASDFYDVDAFLRGSSTLEVIELGEVGDVAGKRLIHLMCHIGLDTLSWARRGAHVTGVDFSAESVAVARDLADRAGLAADFVCSDVLDLPGRIDATFDVVFLSKGVLMWIEDLAAWAEACVRLLRPGGVFYLLEIHPLVMAVGQTETGLTQQGSYFHTRQPAVVVKDGSYAVPDAVLANKESREWTHSLGDVVTALVQAGIRIEFLHEFPAPEQSRVLPSLESDDPQHLLPALYSIRGVRV